MSNELSEGAAEIVDNAVILLTPREAAKKLRVSVSTLRNFRIAKIGPKYIKPNHCYLYPLDELIKYIEVMKNKI
jgi:hypothetical protein